MKSNGRGRIIFERPSEVVVVDDAIIEYFGDPVRDLHLRRGISDLRKSLAAAALSFYTAPDIHPDGFPLNTSDSLLVIAALAEQAKNPESAAFTLIRDVERGLE